MAKPKKEYAFIDLAKEVLTEAKKPLTTHEIWSIAKDKGLDQQLETKAINKEATLNSSIYQDVQKATTVFCIMSKRPMKWGLNSDIKDYEKIDAEDNEKDNKDNKTEKQKRDTRERHLHRLLVSFVRNEPSFGTCYARTIFHEKSKNKSRKDQHWIHPDIVGVTYPFGVGKSYEEKTVKLMESFEHCSCILYSFEMKVSIENSNELREAFFQAVSNSSWAHEGYLVAESFNTDEILEDMTALNSTFGIGFIELNVDNYKESQILFRAKRRKELDWDMIDKLVEKNEDMRMFVQTVMEDLDHSKVHSEGAFDKVFEDDGAFDEYKKRYSL